MSEDALRLFPNRLGGDLSPGSPTSPVKSGRVTRGSAQDSQICLSHLFHWARRDRFYYYLNQRKPLTPWRSSTPGCPGRFPRLCHLRTLLPSPLPWPPFLLSSQSLSGKRGLIQAACYKRKKLARLKEEIKLYLKLLKRPASPKHATGVPPRLLPQTGLSATCPRRRKDRGAFRILPQVHLF